MIVNIYDPLPWQINPWRDKSSIILLTGSAGGGKSRLAAEKMHAFLLRYPCASGLILRKTSVSLSKSVVLLFERQIVGDVGSVRHVRSKSWFEYSNGSVLFYGGMQNEDQRSRIRSIGQKGGIDIAWLEEATEFELADLDAVRARMRGVAAPWRQIILTTNPGAPEHWIKEVLIDRGAASVFYSRESDNPYNPEDYKITLSELSGIEGKRLRDGLWERAANLVYDDAWVDKEGESVSERAEYEDGNGYDLWGVDDGYSGEYDKRTGKLTSNSHPRVFLFAQVKKDGRICIYDESYEIKTLSDMHIQSVLSKGYPIPDYIAIDSSAAELSARLNSHGLHTIKSTHSVEEGIKTTRRFLSPDTNGYRRLIIHPRCRSLRAQMASYQYDDNGKPIKAYDDGPDALRYLVWSLRNED